MGLFVSVRLDQPSALRARGVTAFKDEQLALAPACAPVLAHIDSLDQLLTASYRDVSIPRLDYGRVVLKRGFARRSLPGVVAAGRLPASTENAP